MRVIRAVYNIQSEWKIPAKLNLLSEEENNKKENYGKQGSWWIKWDNLFYIDENGETEELSKDTDACDGDELKRPDEIIDEDDDEEEDDE